MTTKYTSEGKKVAVIVKLNNQETIVQEIFIVGDQEIPSGEKYSDQAVELAAALKKYTNAG